MKKTDKLSKYVFRAGGEVDVDRLIELVDGRMAWMDRMGIDQWNNSHYHERYPRTYYMERARNGELFVLERMSDHTVVAAGVLFETDKRWGEMPESAFYVHHLVALEGEKGAGEAYVRLAADYARSKGKQYLRLDSKIGNASLERWYDRLGFVAVGECIDLYYEGILRQLPL